MTQTPDMPRPPPLDSSRSPTASRWLRLNRPDAMNSLDTALKDALVAALREVGRRPRRALRRAHRDRSRLLRRAGPQGARAQPRRPRRSTLATTVTEHYNPIVTLLATMNKPVVAALNGVAAGAGLELRPRVRLPDRGRHGRPQHRPSPASPSRATPAPRGRCPGSSGRLSAKELLLLPRTVPAAEALALGLRDQGRARRRVRRDGAELARTLADGPTLAYGVDPARRGLSRRRRPGRRPRARGRADDAHRPDRDHRVAVDAFLAKEKPIYTGR